MNIYTWPVVIFVTVLAIFLGIGWLMEWSDAKYERTRLLAELDQAATANVQLPRPGRLEVEYLPGPPFAGASQTGQPDPVPWDLAGAAYQLGQQRARQDDVSAEVDAIMAEIEHNPERWQR